VPAISQNPVAEKIRVGDAGPCCPRIVVRGQRPCLRFLKTAVYSLFNVSKVLVSFELNEHLIHEVDYILHVIFVNGFHGGVHVFQWQ